MILSLEVNDLTGKNWNDLVCCYIQIQVPQKVFVGYWYQIPGTSFGTDIGSRWRRVIGAVSTIVLWGSRKVCRWFKTRLQAGSPVDVNPRQAGLVHLFKPSRARPNVMPDGISTVWRYIEVYIQFPAPFYPSSLDMSFSFIRSLPLYSTCCLVSSSNKSLFPFLSVSYVLYFSICSLYLCTPLSFPLRFTPLSVFVCSFLVTPSPSVWRITHGAELSRFQSFLFEFIYPGKCLFTASREANHFLLCILTFTFGGKTSWAHLCFSLAEHSPNT